MNKESLIFGLAVLGLGAWYLYSKGHIINPVTGQPAPTTATAAPAKTGATLTPEQQLQQAITNGIATHAGDVISGIFSAGSKAVTGIENSLFNGVPTNLDVSSAGEASTYDPSGDYMS